MRAAAIALLLSACCSSEPTSAPAEAQLDAVRAEPFPVPVPASGCPPGEDVLEVVPVFVLQHATDVPPPPPKDGFTVEVEGEEPLARVAPGAKASFCVKPGNLTVTVRAEGFAPVTNTVGAPGIRRFVVGRAVAPGPPPGFGPGKP